MKTDERTLAWQTSNIHAEHSRAAAVKHVTTSSEKILALPNF